PARARSSRTERSWTRPLRASGSSPTTSTRSGGAMPRAYDGDGGGLPPVAAGRRPRVRARGVGTRGVGGASGAGGGRAPGVGAAPPRPSAAGQALLQGLHEVHHLRRRLLGRRAGGDVLALELVRDELLDPLAHLVLVLLGLEALGGDLLDELPGQLHLRLRVAAGLHRDLRDVAHLVRVVEL